MPSTINNAAGGRGNIGQQRLFDRFKIEQGIRPPTHNNNNTNNTNNNNNNTNNNNTNNNNTNNNNTTNNNDTVDLTNDTQ